MTVLGLVGGLDDRQLLDARYRPDETSTPDASEAAVLIPQAYSGCRADRIGGAAAAAGAVGELVCGVAIEAHKAPGQGGLDGAANRQKLLGKSGCPTVAGIELAPISRQSVGLPYGQSRPPALDACVPPLGQDLTTRFSYEVGLAMGMDELADQLTVGWLTVAVGTAEPDADDAVPLFDHELLDYRPAQVPFTELRVASLLPRWDILLQAEVAVGTEDELEHAGLAAGQAQITWSTVDAPDRLAAQVRLDLLGQCT